MWKIFSFLKKKKVLTVKEFDKLVDEKAKDIRKYVLSTLTVRDEINSKKGKNGFIVDNLDVDKKNEEKFLKEFEKVFYFYQKNLYDKYLKLGTKKKRVEQPYRTKLIKYFSECSTIKLIQYFREEKIESPYLTFQKFFEKYGIKKKKKFSFYYNFITKTKIKLSLIYYEIWLYFQIRKIKKLFPDMKLSSKTALGILKSVKVNKKLMAIKTT